MRKHIDRILANDIIIIIKMSFLLIKSIIVFCFLFDFSCILFRLSGQLCNLWVARTSQIDRNTIWMDTVYESRSLDFLVDFFLRIFWLTRSREPNRTEPNRPPARRIWVMWADRLAFSHRIAGAASSGSDPGSDPAESTRDRPRVYSVDAVQPAHRIHGMPSGNHGPLFSHVLRPRSRALFATYTIHISIVVYPQVRIFWAARNHQSTLGRWGTLSLSLSLLSFHSYFRYSSSFLLSLS